MGGTYTRRKAEAARSRAMPHCKQLPWVRHCAHGLWPGTRRTGLGPEFHATASGQVLGAAAPGWDSMQRRARVGSFFIPQSVRGLWPGVAQAWAARPDRDTASGQALVVGGGWAHGLWQGVARAASGLVLRAAALGQGSTQRLLVRYWAQRLRPSVRSDLSSLITSRLTHCDGWSCTTAFGQERDGLCRADVDG